MNDKKGFTLIELLAVIIILGILMIIAIPSVTNYIQGSRKSAYITTVKDLINGARNFVNSGKLGMYNTDTSYYIKGKCIPTENSNKSPYGDFVVSTIIVNYDGNGYSYYWTGVDDTGTGITKITSFDELDTLLIETDVTPDKISTVDSVDGRTKVMVINDDCSGFGTPLNAVMYKFKEETEYLDTCSVGTSFDCDRATVGNSYVLSCEPIYMFEDTEQESNLTSPCPSSTSSFTCNAQTLGNTYKTVTSNGNSMQNALTPNLSDCSPSGSSFTCNTSNLGRQYSFCSSTGSFSQKTKVVAGCTETEPFTCIPESNGMSYTKCMARSDGKYGMNIYTCNASYTETRYTCYAKCKTVTHKCVNKYKVTSKKCSQN